MVESRWFGIGRAAEFGVLGAGDRVGLQAEVESRIYVRGISGYTRRIGLSVAGLGRHRV